METKREQMEAKCNLQTRLPTLPYISMFFACIRWLIQLKPVQTKHLHAQLHAVKDEWPLQFHHQRFTTHSCNHIKLMWRAWQGRDPAGWVACARKCSVKHMVRACSTNQPVLRLSIGSLALITATCWAPGCPSELLGQRGGGSRLWGGWGAKQGKTEQNEGNTRYRMFLPRVRWGWRLENQGKERQKDEVRIMMLDTKR